MGSGESKSRWSRIKLWVEIGAAVGTILGVTASGLAGRAAHAVHDHFDPPDPKRTELVTADPWQARDATARAWRALDGSLTAGCEQPSRAKYATNTHRCFLSDHTIQDPCFDPPIGSAADLMGKVVACLGTPWDRPVYAKVDGKETAFYGSPPSDDPKNRPLWALRLSNKDRCLHYPEGTQVYVGDHPVLFTCEHGDVIDLDDRHQPWRATYFPKGEQESQDVPLTTGWF